MTSTEITRGDGPLVLGLPHTGTGFPAEIASRLNENGRGLADTDWHVDRLYNGLLADVTTVRMTIHRYVIDVNRDPAGNSLYPGQNTTALCPVSDFDGRAIWRDGGEPDAAEIARRTEAYHLPYHQALAGELERARARHGFAVLYDCHSIRSEIPFLFEGRLADFNIGTDGGRTCAASIERSVHAACRAAGSYSSVLNGRFKGGWTTRHHGRPETGIHAIQMELAQSTYMTERPPWTYLPDRADALRGHLKTVLQTLTRWRPE